MLSLSLVIAIFDGIYFIFHESLSIFLGLGLVHLLLFVPLNLFGSHYLFKPIHNLFEHNGNRDKARERLLRLTRYSTTWIFMLGLLFFLLTQIPLFLTPDMFPEIDGFHPEKMPLLFLVGNIPVLLFVDAILPAFICYLLINDFSFDLKDKAHSEFGILYQPGKKRIGLTLVVVFAILVFIPAMLVIIELAIAVELGDQFSQFAEVDPLQMAMIDRFVVLVGMIISIVLLTRSFTRPIDSLLKKMNSVQKGDYSSRAAIMTDDEIGVLTSGFNDMVHELEISHDELADYNRTLEKRVNERTDELKQKNLQLEETLDQLKQMQKQVIVQEKMATLGQLVAGITHEINTPVGAIRSMNNTKAKAADKLQKALASIDLDAHGIERDVQKALTAIRNADHLIDQGTARLDNIIKNLKNFVKLDEAEATLADIHQGLDSVLALMSHDLLSDIEVIRDYGDIPSFVCHARKLNQVFFNILKNAAQAIDNRGQIAITTSLDSNMAHIAIRDTGRGIQPEHLESIFDPGFSTRGASVRTTLGLSICYQIISEHEGTIEVKSKPGEGSVFTIIIPIDFRNVNK